MMIIQSQLLWSFDTSETLLWKNRRQQHYVRQWPRVIIMTRCMLTVTCAIDIVRQGLHAKQMSCSISCNCDKPIVLISKIRFSKEKEVLFLQMIKIYDSHHMHSWISFQLFFWLNAMAIFALICYPVANREDAVLSHGSQQFTFWKS